MVTDGAYLNPTELVQKLGLRPGLRVGDFGAGGAAAFGLPMGRAVGKEGTVYLFDVLKTALSGALSIMQLNGLTNSKAVWCNLELYQGARGIPSDSLDAGVLVNVLHQTEKSKDILAEVHRMLKAGGKLLIADWHREAKLNFAPEARNRLTAEHVLEVARKLGFSPLETFEAGPYHWGLILAKT